MNKKGFSISPLMGFGLLILLVVGAVAIYFGGKMIASRSTGNSSNVTEQSDNSIVNPIPDGCMENFITDYSCWTSEFPESIEGRSDVACSFSVQCCGVTIQGWEYEYPEAAGLRGVAGGSTVVSSVSCGDEIYKLDIDQDGIPNTEDPDPNGTGSLTWE